MPNAPQWFEKQLTDFRGKSIYGDPVLRVVWGADERDWRGHYKYLWPDGKPMNCFILERWQPAGFFGSRDEWEKQSSFYDNIHQEWVDIKGPFPQRGQYVMVEPLVNGEGEHIPLDETVLQAIKNKVRNDEYFAEIGNTARGHMVAERREKINAENEYQADRRQEFIREDFAKKWDSIDRNARRGYNITPR